MTVLSKIKSHPDVEDYLKELPFYNKPIKKPKIKRLKNIDQLHLFFFISITTISVLRLKFLTKLSIL